MPEEYLSDFIQKYREGQSGAFEQIIQKMSPLVKKFVRKFPGNDREDMYQEFLITLMECTRQIPDYSVEARCLIYFKTAVIRRYIALKKQTLTPEYLSETAEFFQDTLADSEDFYSAIELEFVFQELRQTLPPTKQLILDGFLNGFSCPEIAERLHISRQYIHSVRTEIRKKLAGYLN